MPILISLKYKKGIGTYHRRVAAIWCRVLMSITEFHSKKYQILSAIINTRRQLKNTSGTRNTVDTDDC